MDKNKIFKVYCYLDMFSHGMKWYYVLIVISFNNIFVIKLAFCECLTLQPKGLYTYSIAIWCYIYEALHRSRSMHLTLQQKKKGIFSDDENINMKMAA